MAQKIFSDVTKVHFNCYLMWKIAKVLDGEIKVSYVDEKTAILIEGKKWNCLFDAICCTF